MGLSATHIVILAVVAVLLFGGGRFSNIMGDVAKGVKQFKKGMADDDDDVASRTAARLQTPTPIDPAVDRDLHAAPMRDDGPRP
jgi:sec-independent protein translocase protein TatA